MPVSSCIFSVAEDRVERSVLYFLLFFLYWDWSSFHRGQSIPCRTQAELIRIRIASGSVHCTLQTAHFPLTLSIKKYPRLFSLHSVQYSVHIAHWSRLSTLQTEHCSRLNALHTAQGGTIDRTQCSDCTGLNTTHCPSMHSLHCHVIQTVPSIALHTAPGTALNTD